MRSFQHVFIPIYYPSLNQMLRILKGKRGMQAYTRKKNDLKSDTAMFFGKLKPVKCCKIGFIWVEPHNRRDWGNVTFAEKYIMDSLVDAGILPDDSRKYVKRVTHDIQEKPDKENPGVHLMIEEIDG